MRFFRKARNVVRRQSRHHHQTSSADGTDAGTHDDWPMFGRSLFQNIQPTHMNSYTDPVFNFQPVTVPSVVSEMPTYIPKCIGGTSASEILQGSPPSEDFSSNCWLNGHLHEFRTASGLFDTNSPGEIDGDSLDDSSSEGGSSSSGYHVSSITDDDESWDDIHQILYDHVQAPDYFMVMEPPPEGFPDSPPTYEEAMGIWDLSSDVCSSLSSTRSLFSMSSRSSGSSMSSHIDVLY